VKFLVDEGGKKTAVILDLRRNRALWEDVYDSETLISPVDVPPVADPDHD